MTVEELISKLAGVPPTTPVFIYLEKLGLPLTIDQVVWMDGEQIHLISEE